MAQTEVQDPRLYVHSQSNRPGAPLDFRALDEQAFDSRALTLPEQNSDLVATSTPIDPNYLDYMGYVLKLDVPNVITPLRNGDSLSASMTNDQQVIREITERQQASGRPFVLSVFDPTEEETALLTKLQEAGVQVIPEVNFEVAKRLGNKAGFREFCQRYGIPQISGGAFQHVEELKAFILRSQKRRYGILIKRSEEPKKVMVKHPNGTAGEGIDKVPAGIAPDENDLKKWEQWIQESGSVVAELYHPDRGGEHALHIYIDPVTQRARITGIYDQLTVDNGKGGQAHKGARSPMENKRLRKKLIRLAHEKIIPALLQEGYTGPACFDLLSESLHFMELNTRAGANYYADREVEKVAERLYGKPSENAAFFFMAGNESTESTFAEFYSKHWEALQPQAEGTLIFTNPSRHVHHRYDIVAYSPNGSKEAERIMYQGFVKIWGQEEAKRRFGEIHKRGKKVGKAKKSR